MPLVFALIYVAAIVSGLVGLNDAARSNLRDPTGDPLIIVTPQKGRTLLLL